MIELGNDYRAKEKINYNKQFKMCKDHILSHYKHEYKLVREVCWQRILLFRTVCIQDPCSGASILVDRTISVGVEILTNST